MRSAALIAPALVICSLASCGRDLDVGVTRAVPDADGWRPPVPDAAAIPDAAPPPIALDAAAIDAVEGALLAVDVRSFGFSPGGTGMVRVRNAGVRPTGAIELALTGNAKQAFAITDPGCEGLELPPGGRCTVAVSTTREAKQTSSAFATLSISAAPGGSIDVTYDVRQGLARREWIGHWKLDGDASDASGFGNHATVRTGTTVANAPAVTAPTFVAGPDGLAIALDGTQWIEAPHAPSFDQPSSNDEFTIAAWVRADELPSADAVDRQSWILGQEEEGTTFSRFGLLLVAGVPTCAVHFDWAQAQDMSPVPLGTWVHLAAVYDGLTCVVYRDGVPVGERDMYWFIAPDTTPVILGAQAFPPSLHGLFHGALDDVRLANRAMPPWTIRALAGR